MPKNRINFFDYACSVYKHLSLKTCYTYKSAMNYIMKFSNKSLTLDRITTQFCRNFRNYLIERVSPNSALMYIVRFRTILNTAVQDKIIESNPCISCRIKRTEVLPKFLTEKEIRKLKCHPMW